VGFDDIRVVSK